MSQPTERMKKKIIRELAKREAGWQKAMKKSKSIVGVKIISYVLFEIRSIKKYIYKTN